MPFCGSPTSSDSSNSSNSSNSSSSSSGGSSSSSQESPLPANNGIENIGLAVFKDDKMVGKLDEIDTLSNLIVTNQLKSCRLSIPDPDDEDKTIDLFLTFDASPQIKVNILNGTPYITIKAKMNSRISSISQISNTVTEERITKIEESASHYLKNYILNYLYKTAKEFKADISGTGKYALSSFKTSSDFEDYNWLANFENAFFSVETDVKIRSSFLLTGS